MADPTDLTYITEQLTALYASLHVAPTGRGTGATDIAYYADNVAATGGWQGGNAGYWTDKITADVLTSKANVPAPDPPQVPAPDPATFADLTTAVATLSTLVDASEARIIARIDGLQAHADAFVKSIAPYFPQVPK